VSFTPTIVGSGVTATGGTLTARYALMGNVMLYTFTLSGVTISGAPATQTEVHVSIPFPIVSTISVGNGFNHYNGGNWSYGMVYALNGESIIHCLANYVNGSAVNLWGTVILPK
jgi:hypothetical protein